MQVYRARSSLVWGWLCVGLGVLLGAGGVMASGQGSAQQGLGFGACLVLIGVAGYLRPALIVTGDAVTLKNVFHTSALPLSRIEEIRLNWSLEIHGDDGMTIRSFAAPTSRATRTSEASRQHGEAGSNDHAAPSSSRPATMVYDAWQEWRAAHFGSSGSVEGTPSVTRWLDPIGLGLIVVGIVAGVVGVIG